MLEKIDMTGVWKMLAAVACTALLSVLSTIGFMPEPAKPEASTSPTASAAVEIEKITNDLKVQQLDHRVEVLEKQNTAILSDLSENKVWRERMQGNIDRLLDKVDQLKQPPTR